MRRSRFRRTVAASAALVTGAGLAAWPAAQADAGKQDPSSWRVVASGLDSPRGLTFGPDGSLYVIEAGVGGPGNCFPHPVLGEMCFGASGALTKVSKHGQQRRILTGLPSFAVTGTPEVIGPSDVGFAGGKLYATLGLGADPSVRDPLPAPAQNSATLVRVKESQGTYQVVADIGDNELANNPDGGLPDSNPHGLLTTRGGFIVADAGGNALLGIDKHGTFSTLAVFPNRLVPNPFGGPDIPMQAVPTTVTRGPDGALYVGQLTGFPFPIGGANVYRVVPGHTPQVFAAGFTNIIDIAFGPVGSLYVLEIRQNSLLSTDETGALIRIDRHGNRTIIASSGLVAPTGLLIRNGRAYVSNCGVCAGTGEVISIPLPH